MANEQGPRGGIHRSRFDLVLPPRLHAELEWVARHREVSMAQVAREAIRKVCEEERARVMQEFGVTPR